MNATPSLQNASTGAASVGPTTRALCAPPACSEIALGRSECGTECATIAWLAGALKEKIVPMPNANGSSRNGVRFPVSAMAAHADISTVIDEYVARRTLRRSTRSATTPAIGVKKSIGEKFVKNNRPSHRPLVSVSRDISACIAMNAIQNPN
jgi:hypothetical protein